MKAFELFFENLIFASRWILAPLFFGLALTQFILLAKFLQELWHMVPHMFEADANTTILAVLGLVDITLVAGLVLMIILAGYENFVSKIDTAGHDDRPAWMGHVDFSDLKIKVIGSLVAISAIQLLRAFLTIQDYTKEDLGWLIGLHLTFVASGVFLALMDWLGGPHTPKSDKEAGH